MTCQEFWDAMPELEGQPAADAATHLAGCAVCGAALNNQRVLVAGLRAAAADWRRTKAPGRVEAKLLAAFRGQAGLAAPSPARHWWSTALAWSAAAVVVAGAFLLFTTRARQPQAPTSPSASTELAAIDWSARLPAELTAEGAGEGFIPVPNADRLPPNEGPQRRARGSAALGDDRARVLGHGGPRRGARAGGCGIGLRRFGSRRQVFG